MTTKTPRTFELRLSSAPLQMSVSMLPVEVLLGLSESVALSGFGENPPAALVTLTGELDVTTAPLVGRFFVATLRQHSAIACDLADVTFMDVTGLRPFLVGRQLARGIGAHFWIMRTSPQVRLVLDTTESNYLREP